MSKEELVKGTLIVKATKSGAQYQVEYETKKGKTAFPIPDSGRAFRPEDAQDGMEVDVVKVGGRPVKVTIPGAVEAATTSREEAMQRNPPRSGHGHRGSSQTMPNHGPAREDATAPYNFVPVRRERIAHGFHPPRPGEGTFSGRIVCRLEALTPFVVGGPGDTGTRDKERQSARVVEWCSVSGQPVIPGSSLKGCLRSVLEALSFSSLWPTSETTVAARDVSNARSNYHDRIKRAGGARSGWLVRSGPRWTIRTCENAVGRIADLLSHAGVQGADRFAERPGDEKTRRWREAGARSLRFDAESRPSPNGGQRLEVSRLGSGSHEGWPVFTGFIQKKTRDAVFMGPTADSIDVPDEVWNDFQDQMTDAQRKLWKEREEAFKRGGLPGIPIFWLAGDSSGRSVEAIGTTRFMRIPVRHQPRDLAPTRPDDLASTIFGFVDHAGGGARRGRAWVTSARLIGKAGSTSLSPAVVPGQPQPSAVSLYLEQDPSQVGTFGRNQTNENLRDYDSDRAQLRGRKLYWHRDLDYPPPPNDNANVQVKYRTLPASTVFEFEVMLDGLDAAEAGAVLSSIELPDGHAHRLGGGKAFGQGSVRLSVVSLEVGEDRIRSRSLADRTRSGADADRDALKSAFVSAIAARVGFPAENYEQQPEIQAFRRMMDRDHRPAKEKTAYMELNDRSGGPSYKSKPILRAATAIT